MQCRVHPLEGCVSMLSSTQPCWPATMVLGLREVEHKGLPRVGTAEVHDPASLVRASAPEMTGGVLVSLATKKLDDRGTATRIFVAHARGGERSNEQHKWRARMRQDQRNAEN